MYIIVLCSANPSHKNQSGDSGRKTKSTPHNSQIRQTTYLVGGWATPLKNMKVNWDDDIPNIWEHKKWQPNHQPVTDIP